MCIMDDRSDVWHFAPNVVQVLPYHFFQHTGDINAPPGLQKKENDSPDKGYDFSNLEQSNSKTIEPSQEEIDSGAAQNPFASLPTLEQQKEDDRTNYSDDDESNNSTSSDHFASAANKKKSVDDSKVQRKIKSYNENLNSKTEECILNTNSPSKPIIEEINTDSKHSNQEDSEPRLSVYDSNNGALCQDVTIVNKVADKKENDADEDDSCIMENQCAEEKNRTKSYVNISTKNKTCDEEIPASQTLQVEQEVLDVPDYDDYLLHLEDILQRIHDEFYSKYKPSRESLPRVPGSNTDALPAAPANGLGALPDMKAIVPEIRGRVLKCCNIVFSGVVPQATDLVNSKVN